MVGVAVCPHPPLLVGEIARGAAAELDELRAACDEAVRRMLATGPEAVVVVSSGPSRRLYPPSGNGDFGRYGVPELRVSFGAHNCAGPSELPLGQLVGGWLLARSGFTGRRLGHTVTSSEAPADCAALGEDLVDTRGTLGLLVMGDGSARRTSKAPGHHDRRALPFDERVAAALAAPDPAALAALDPVLAEELMVAGRAPWQVLAGAAAGRQWSAELLYHDGPYGVGYFVAAWT